MSFDVRWEDDVSDVVGMIRKGIQAAGLSPESVARADAAIALKVGREVSRAVRLVGTFARFAPAEPATADERLVAMRATGSWDGLSDACKYTLELAVANSDSFESAAEMILDAVPGARL
jgi:hypothetical protein